MNPDEIGHIFDPFSQGVHFYGGLGLGLAISRALVELHSGSIQASSPGKNKGAAFSIELPLIKFYKKKKVENSQSASISTPIAISVKMTSQRCHILLVEDHEATRLTLTQLLLNRRYKVTGAGTFAQAQSLISSNGEFHMLISDIGLPDGNGYDLMIEFKKKFGVNGIALTGYGMEQDVTRSELAGFATHLTKPIRIELLENALAAALNVP